MPLIAEQPVLSLVRGQGRAMTLLEGESFSPPARASRATFHTGRLEEALDGCLTVAAGGGEDLAHAI